jgi:PAS domain S-box-containing protein
LIRVNEKVIRILLVEDDEDDYIITRELLSRAHLARYQVDWAPSFASGKRLLETNLYDAVLMDYDLGDGTGIDLIRELAGRGYPAPILLLTGRGTPEVDVEAMEAGASVYLNKSDMNAMLLERSIRSGMERKQIEAQLLARNQELDWELARRRRMEEALIESEELMRLALGAAALGVWKHDIPNNRIYLDERSRRHYGFEQSEVSLEDVLARIHPEDLPRLSEEMTAATGPGGDGHFETVYRVIHPGGNLLWLSIQVRVFFLGEPRQAVLGIGTSEDISARMHREHSLHYQAELLRRFPEPVIAADAENIITYWNETAQAVFGWSEAEALGRNGFELLRVSVPGMDLDTVIAEIFASDHYEGEALFIDKAGRSRTYYSRVAVLRDEAGQVTGTVTSLRDY